MPQEDSLILMQKKRIEKDQIQQKLESFELERSKWWTAKLNVRVIPIGNENRIFHQS